MSPAFAAPRPRPALITLDMVSTQQGWAMNTAGQVLKTSDGGQQWTNAGNPALARAIQHAATNGSFYLHGPAPGGNLVASFGNGTYVAFPNAWTAWFTLPVGGDALQIWHTSDGGQHWTSAVISHAAPPGGMGFSEIAAVGNHDAWVMAATQDLLGYVAFRIWCTSVHETHWHPIFQGTAPNTEGLAFANGSVGVLAEGSNLVTGPQTGAAAVTTTGGHTWSFTGDGAPQSRAVSQRSALPLLPGNWQVTTMDPAAVPHTTDLRIAVVMASPLPSNPTPGTMQWRLEQSSNGGQTWHMLPKPLRRTCLTVSGNPGPLVSSSNHGSRPTTAGWSFGRNSFRQPMGDSTGFTRGLCRRAP